MALPNGGMLYWKPDGAGGTLYTTDEVGGGSVVWDTSLVSEATLLAAINIEKSRASIHNIEEENANQGSTN